MKAFAIVIMTAGVFIVLGSVGQSDFETIVLGNETTPFWQISLRCLAGIALLCLGKFLFGEEESHG